jgi:flagellar basal-body rod modification protein FlgD
MTVVTNVTPNTTSTTSSSSSSSSSSVSTIDYNTFLKLLIAQLKYQDPTSPADSTQFVSQLASFSSVEQGIQTNSKLESLLTAQTLDLADSMIGKTVTSADGTVSGVVKSVSFTSDGTTATLQDGSTLTLGSGITVSQS